MNLIDKLWAIFGLILLTISGLAVGADRKLLIIGEEHPPYEMTDSAGKVVGIDIDIVTHIFGKMGIDFEVRLFPWKRAWAMIKNGEAEAALSVSRNDERTPYLIFPKEDMWLSEFVFFCQANKKQSIPIGYKEAKRQKLKIGVIAGNSYHKSFWEAFPYQDEAKTVLHPQLDGATNIGLNFTKLVNNRFDLFPYDRSSGRYEIKRLNYVDKISWYDSVLFSKGYPMPFVKNSQYPDLPSIAERFEKELIALKRSAKYREILDKWLN